MDEVGVPVQTKQRRRSEEERNAAKTGIKLENSSIYGYNKFKVGWIKERAVDSSDEG